MTQTKTPPDTTGNAAVVVTPKYPVGRFLRGSVNDSAELFAHYPPGAREDAEWLRHFTQSRCGGEHAILGRIAKAIGLKDRTGKEPSDQYWYQVVTGKYFTPGGSVDTFRRYVAGLRAHAKSLETSSSVGHVDTENWKMVRDYIDSRRTFSRTIRMGGIEGLTGSGKTYCTSHYAAINNHKETIRIEAPARATRSRVVQKIAELYEVPVSSSCGDKEVEIERFLKSAAVRTLDTNVEARPRTIIVDNIQRMLRPNVQPDQQPIFNYFHELQDDTGCCVIFTWVPSFTKVLKGGHPFWAQFLGRMGGDDEILQLDQKPTKGDLLKYARAFAVQDDARALPLLTQWASTIYGLRRLILKLEGARALATKRRLKEIPVDILEELNLEAVKPAATEDGEGGAS
ncbi:MAG: ATP-binding protein [Verrucomicrobiota bacterium]